MGLGNKVADRADAKKHKEQKKNERSDGQRDMWKKGVAVFGWRWAQSPLVRAKSGF